jgi:multidrug efflux pump subunit AcrB
MSRPAFVTLLALLAGDRFLEAAPRPATPRPVIVVEATYPGAPARAVADTVADPIERQISGVEGLAAMRSRCTDDGTFTLTLTFQNAVGVDRAQARVQERISQALPTLPDAVKRCGVTVKRRSPGVLLFVAVSSPDGRYGPLYLGSYGSLTLKRELARLPGVAELTSLGQRDHAIRFLLDADRLARLKMSVSQVLDALKEHNVHVAAEPIGQPAVPGGLTPPTFTVLGPPPDPEQLDRIKVKSTPDGQEIPLRMIARVAEVASGPERAAFFHGQQVALLAVHLAPDARPRDVSAAVQRKLADLRAKPPEGIRLAVALDFAVNLQPPFQSATPEYLLDLVLPASASAQRALEALKQCQQLVAGVEGVQEVLGLAENPFDGTPRPCVLAHLAPALARRASRGQVVRTICDRTDKELPAVLVRLRELWQPGNPPRCGWPIDLAVHGPEADGVAKLATRLAERLAQGDKLTDVLADPESMPRPRTVLVIDRQQAKDRGVGVNDLRSTLESYAGPLSAADFNPNGRTWQLSIPADDFRGVRAEDLRQLKVRNARGEIVALSDFAAVRADLAPGLVARLDGRPMVEITGNPTAGLSVAQARTLCDRLAEEVRKELHLSADYRLAWLEEPGR